MATNKHNGNCGCRDESSPPPSPPSSSTPAAEVDVQLGFAIPLSDSTRPVLGHRSHEWWEDWDGGKIGGKPSWLNPRDLPPGPVRCDDCASASGDEGGGNGGDRGGESGGPLMRFVAQLYCPADDEDGDESDDDGAFHRSLYVFACPAARHSRCDGEGGGVNRAGVKVLRCQMARRNPFYPFEEGDAADEDGGGQEEWDRHRPEFWGVKLCAVCGQRSHRSASAEGGGDNYHDDDSPSFCSMEHRDEYRYRRHAKKDRTDGDGDDEGPNLPSVLREMEMVVEEEPGEDDASAPPPPPEGGGGGTSREESIRLRQQLEQLRLLAGASEVGGDDGDDEDATLEQEDLNRLAGVPEGMGTTEIDVVTAAFLDRIGRERSQCLRYERGGDPLWVSGRCVPDDGDRGGRIPNCPYCGSERRFEFQVMPQMLHYLGVNGGVREPASVEAGTVGRGEEEDDMDWGTIAVYTCSKSCDRAVGNVEGTEEGSAMGGAYKEEFAWRQPPIS